MLLLGHWRAQARTWRIVPILKQDLWLCQWNVELSERKTKTRNRWDKHLEVSAVPDNQHVFPSMMLPDNNQVVVQFTDQVEENHAYIKEVVDTVFPSNIRVLEVNRSWNRPQSWVLVQQRQIKLKLLMFHDCRGFWTRSDKRSRSSRQPFKPSGRSARIRAWPSAPYRWCLVSRDGWRIRWSQGFDKKIKSVFFGIQVRSVRTSTVVVEQNPKCIWSSLTLSTHRTRPSAIKQPRMEVKYSACSIQIQL